MNPLLPCPFCGSKAQNVYMNGAEFPHYRVMCTNRVCDAHGPRGPILSDIESDAWNARMSIGKLSDHDSAFRTILASLAAAVSLLEHGGVVSAPSDAMFKAMLEDYNNAIDLGRSILTLGHNDIPE